MSLKIVPENTFFNSTPSSSSLDHYTSATESTPFESKDSARGSSAKIFGEKLKLSKYIDDAPTPPQKPPDSYSLSSNNESSLPEDSSPSQACPQEIATNTILRHKIQKQKSNLISRLPEIDKNLPVDSDEYDFCKDNVIGDILDKFGSVDSLDTKSSMEPIPDGALNRFAYGNYKDKHNSCVYQLCDDADIPLLSTTKNARIANITWKLINAFLELNLDGIAIQTTANAKKTSLLHQEEKIFINKKVNASRTRSLPQIKSSLRPLFSSKKSYNSAEINDEGYPNLMNEEDLSVFNFHVTTSTTDEESSWSTDRAEAHDQMIILESTALIECASNDPLTILHRLVHIGQDKSIHASCRDEIYAQIMKQLHNCPFEMVAVNAWVLLALVCSSFLPSDNIRKSEESYF